jgi:hypothetical protein
MYDIVIRAEDEMGVVTLDLKFIEELHMRILGGEYDHVAARVLGVPGTTYARWKRVGRELDQEGGEPETDMQALCGALVRSIEKAEAMLEAEWVRMAVLTAQKATESGRGGGTNQWLTLLGRRFAARWAEKASAPEKARVASADELFAALDRETGSSTVTGRRGSQG